MTRVAVAVPLATVVLLGLAGCRDDGPTALAPGPTGPVTGASAGLLDGVDEALDAVERDVGRDPDAGSGPAPVR